MTPFDELFLFLPQCILKENFGNFLDIILNLIHIFSSVILLDIFFPVTPTRIDETTCSSVGEWDSPALLFLSHHKGRKFLRDCSLATSEKGKGIMEEKES